MKSHIEKELYTIKARASLKKNSHSYTSLYNRRPRPGWHAMNTIEGLKTRSGIPPNLMEAAPSLTTDHAQAAKISSKLHEIEADIAHYDAHLDPCRDFSEEESLKRIVMYWAKNASVAEWTRAIQVAHDITREEPTN